jgi:hypothetical protein
MPIAHGLINSRASSQLWPTRHSIRLVAWYTSVDLALHMLVLRMFGTAMAVNLQVPTLVVTNGAVAVVVVDNSLDRAALNVLNCINKQLSDASCCANKQ